MNFAHTEMKVVMGMLLHEYDLVLIDRQPDKLHSIGIQRPGACRVRYQRHTTGGLNAQKHHHKRRRVFARFIHPEFNKRLA